MTNLPIDDEVLGKISMERKLRRALGSASHVYFFHIYFAHYVQHETAPFQQEILTLTEDPKTKFLVVEAFRGSGKSTLMTLSLPLWAVLGKREEKYVIILAKTQPQARQYLANIKKEIESNDMLRADLGPFQEQEDEWRMSSIVIPKYGARITAASVDSALRGVRHREHRPGLVIADDLEDLESVRQQEQRDKLWAWYTGDVMPMGTERTQYAVIGTRLHDDSLIMRLRKSIESGERPGVFRRYPLIDEGGKALWPSRFPDQASLDSLKKSIADHAAFEREYMLRIIPDGERVVRPEWIQRYKEMPVRRYNDDFRVTLTGVDLAISKETSADYTAMVSISAFKDKDSRWSVYVHPDPVNERLDFPEARKRITEVSRSLGFDSSPTPIWIESVGYQAAMVQDLRSDGFPAEEFQVHGQDKRMRLSLVTHLIRDGIVRFPERGCETLVNQLIGFGTERHDDLADAFAIALHAIMNMMTEPVVVVPRLETVIPKVPTQAEGEKGADRELILISAMQRGDANAGREYVRILKEKRAAYWQGEELEVFRKMMGG